MSEGKRPRETHNPPSGDEANPLVDPDQPYVSTLQVKDRDDTSVAVDRLAPISRTASSRTSVTLSSDKRRKDGQHNASIKGRRIRVTLGALNRHFFPLGDHSRNDLSLREDFEEFVKDARVLEKTIWEQLRDELKGHFIRFVTAAEALFHAMQELCHGSTKKRQDVKEQTKTLIKAVRQYVEKSHRGGDTTYDCVLDIAKRLDEMLTKTKNLISLKFRERIAARKSIKDHWKSVIRDLKYLKANADMNMKIVMKRKRTLSEEPSNGTTKKARLE